MAWSGQCPSPSWYGRRLAVGCSVVEQRHNGQWDGVQGPLRDTVKELHATNYNLEAAEKVMENAYKMYNKSRPKPSSESCVRAKELDKAVGFHPSLGMSTYQCWLVGGRNKTAIF
jgi:hypothetical protein